LSESAPRRLTRLAVSAQIAAGVRMHAGPFGLPLAAVHRDADPAILASVLEHLGVTLTAPLPTDPLHGRALARIELLRQAGGTVLLGGALPDDVTHRMGWRIPPSVVDLADTGSPAALAEQRSDPIGPPLAVVHWSAYSEVAAYTRAAPRYADGTAVLAGVSDPGVGTLAVGSITGQAPSSPHADAVAPAWTAGRRRTEPAA
jgi:hypothetical protein